MTFNSTYNYKERTIFDVQTLFEALRFIIINFILAFILLFLALEEIDWAIFSSTEKINKITIDNTSWNIKTLF